MIILPHPYGRMANRLVLASTFIAQAEEHGDSFLNLGFFDYFHYFQGTKHFPILYYRSRNPAVHHRTKLAGYVNIWNTYDKRGENFYLNQDPFLAQQRATRFLFVIGWMFRAPDLVLKHKDVIRKYFAPIPRHADAVSRVAERLRSGADHVVGVHMRQTDYQHFANGKYFYSHAVYRRVMQELAAQLKGRIRFLICSDAPVDLSFFRDLDVVAGPGHPLEDNYSLATCDYMVGPPSTYTAWASYYGGVPKCFIESAEDSLALSRFAVTETL